MKDGTIGICDFVDDTMSFTSIYKVLTNKTIASDKMKLFIETNGLKKDDTKFITSFGNAKFITNSTSVNIILQEIFNPPNDDIHDNIPSNHKYENKFTFRVGDEIIRTENDYSGEVFRANGEEATILQFDGKLVKIEYKTSSGKQIDNIIDVGVDELYENFQLNYCITVHKSQGSQYVNVVFLIEPNTSFIDKKSIYTAISRAREKCFIIANQTDFISLQNNIGKDILKKTLFMVESNKYG
jgi:exodeoxyribonuclease V alpha subunit